MRSAWFTRACLLVALLLLAGCCAKPSTTSLPEARRVASAVAQLSVPQGKQPTPQYAAAMRVVRDAVSPEALELLVGAFGDERPTPLLESMENVDGTPVRYTVGDALFFVLVRHFAPSDRYFEDDREPPYLQTKESFTAWAKANNFDLGKMRADYRRDKR